MIQILALPLLLTLAADPEPVSLNRVFAKGEKDQYAVESRLQVERRYPGVETWIPEDIELTYKFTSEVTEMLPDGVAKIHYRRPTLTQSYGETFDSPARSRVENQNLNLSLTVSSANELISHSDFKKNVILSASKRGQGQSELDPFLKQFIDELYRLAAFSGSLDNSLDFSPKLPLGRVRVGDSWKHTIGYQPQKLKGAGSSMAVQRLDYVYTYKGPMTSSGRSIIRVNAGFSLNSNLASYANQMSDSDGALKDLPVNLTASIDFDLDPKTLRTILATATSEGGFRIVTDIADGNPIEEVKMKGRTTLRLIGTAQTSFGQ